MPRDSLWLLDMVRHEQTVSDLRRYFAERPSGQTFTGRAFESIGGGGDRPEVRDRITSEDLVAVEMLSVQVPPDVSIALLQGDLGAAFGAHLAAIPVDVEIGTARGRDVLLENNRASAAWKLLNDESGIGWVTAGKLLARKRPRLIPVYDRVVKGAIEAPAGGAWAWFQDRLENDEVRNAISQAGAQAVVPPHVSTLRTLDVILWMRHR